MSRSQQALVAFVLLAAKHLAVARGTEMPGAEVKSKKQIAYLLSQGSPLTKKQKEKLKRELHSKKVKTS
jgi:hypothetical protein